jgi:phage shock protein E
MSRRSPWLRPKASVAGVLVGAFLLGACSASAASEPTAAAGAVTVLTGPDAASLLGGRDDIVVIDVRTPAEYASGHVEGALLADVQRADFDAQVDALDREVTYVLYCRSGNRSAVAAERMRAAGFTDLYDAGAFTDLARAGVPTA